MLLLDQPIARVMDQAGTIWLAVFRLISWFGQGGVILAPSGLLVLACLWLRPRLPSLAVEIGRLIRQAGYLFAAVAAAGLINDALKILVGRARPGLWLHSGVSGLHFPGLVSEYQSFPSGHTATSVAAAIALSTLTPRWRLFGVGFALVIGFSRIALNAHFLSDVLAGAAVGALSAGLVTRWFALRGWIGISGQSLTAHSPIAP